MNKEVIHKQVTQMAESCGFSRTHTGDVELWLCNKNDLEDFAKLVAAHTLMNIDPSQFMSHQEGIEAGRLAEREAIIDLVAMYGGPVDLEAAIRARGQA